MKKNDSIDPLVKKANAKIQKWIALGDQSADLDLSSLTSAVGLTLPESVGGDLDLSSLASVEGLTLPTNVGQSLDLFSLTSAEGPNRNIFGIGNPKTLPRHLSLILR